MIPDKPAIHVTTDPNEIRAARERMKREQRPAGAQEPLVGDESADPTDEAADRAFITSSANLSYDRLGGECRSWT